MQRVHIIISGEVQGIGFRAWVRRQAEAWGLTGWVRNRDDGTVEVVTEGPREKLEQLVKRCHHGPDVAWVEKVEIVWGKATGEFINFKVVR